LLPFNFEDVFNYFNKEKNIFKIDNTTYNEYLEDKANTSTILSIIGIMILTTGSILALIIIGDCFIPAFHTTLSNIPGVTSFLESIYSGCNYIIS